jgi:hypothetical protein
METDVPGPWDMPEEEEDNEAEEVAVSSAADAVAMPKSAGTLPESILSAPVARDREVTSNPNYIVVGFTPDQFDQEIKEEDVVRAPNGRYWRKEDTDSIIQKSNASCPTYGTCGKCFRCGPVADVCCSDPENGRTYIFVVMYHGYYTIIDSEWLSKLMDTQKVVAKADRVWIWERVPTRRLTLDMVREEISRKYLRRGLSTEEEINSRIVDDVRRYIFGMMEEGSGWWDILIDSVGDEETSHEYL